MPKHLLLSLAIPLMLYTAASSPAQAQWKPIGLSGGGGLFAAAMSPTHPNRLMINCDMSAAYLSDDDGMTWRMINHLQLVSSTQCSPAFAPKDPNTIFAANGWAGMKVSHDGGKNWNDIGDLPGNLQGEIAINPMNSNEMLVGSNGGCCISLNGGLHWTRCQGPMGTPIAFCFENDQPRYSTSCYAATDEGVWRSDDEGKTWISITNGLPPSAILSFYGASNPRNGLFLYCTVKATTLNGRYHGGIYRSTNRGDSWECINGAGLNLDTKAFDQWAMGPVAQYRYVASSDANPRIVYASNSSTGVPPPHNCTIFRSSDAGATWKPVFQADPRFPNCNVPPDYMVDANGQYFQDVIVPVVDPHNPIHIFAFMNGCCYVTTDGGNYWMLCFTRRAPERDTSNNLAKWICNGLVITTTWNYYVDPFIPNIRYICYTDLGFARSLDGGKTWEWWARNGRPPWENTCYQLAFDPKIPGKIWGAFSDVHDIPNDNIISGRHRSDLPGGVCVSTDYGAKWKPCSIGLPPKATTSIVIDPRSPVNSRTLYAGQFGGGVFKSTDSGATWHAINTGLGSKVNLRVCRIYLHPDGSLFALVTALRQGGEYRMDGVGLYRFDPKRNSWTWINRTHPLYWPKDFTVDPHNSKIIYVGACDAKGEKQGGLYRTTDGGATWKLLARKGPQTFGAYLSPFHPGWIYMTLTEDAPGAGLWLSKDNGKTWMPVSDMPFGNVQRIAFDPREPNAIFATTFGGSVWKGPAEGL